MLKVGIVGLGVISQVHIKAIEEMQDVQLIAVCDIDVSKRNMVPGAIFYKDIEDMLKTEKLDCLQICLPHYLHVPIALLAAKYQVNVFMEKPIGMSSKDIGLLSDVENKNAIKLGTCFQNRNNETTIKMQRILHKKTYGEIKGCKAIITWNRTQKYYDKDPWRGTLCKSGGGVMLSQAIHTLDLMYVLLGPVKWVKGFAGNLFLEEIEVEDTACAHMKFKSGASGIFYSTVTHCHNSFIEIEVVCDDAVLKIKDGKLILCQQQEEIILVEDAIETNEKSYYGNKHYQAIRSFYDALLSNSDEYIHIDEAAWSVRIIDSVIESSNTNKRVYLSEVGMAASGN